MGRYTSHINSLCKGIEAITLLDNETGLQISCIPQWGFILSSIKLLAHPEHGDIELLYRKKDIPGKLENGMCPILFPIVGKLVSEHGEDSYTWQGRSFKMPMHGFAKDLPWQVIEVSSDDKSAWITARLKDNEITRKAYDFDFRFDMTYRLTNGRLEIVPKIKSAGPFSFGIHPFFNVPSIPGAASAKDGCSLKIPAKTYWEEENLVPTGRKLPCVGELALMEGAALKNLDVDLAFTDMQANEKGLYCCKYTDSHNGVCIRIEADGKIFPEVVLYSPREAPYVCIENWTSPPNALDWSSISAATILQTTLSIIPSITKSHTNEIKC